MAELLKMLTEVGGVSGDEGRVRQIIKQEISSFVDDIYTDKIGNLIAYKKGTKGGRKVMLCAHMDEVGFIITGIGEDGMLKFKTVGGIDPRVLVSKKVLIGEKGYPGVLGIKAIHLQEPEERQHAVKVKQMYIDIGATSKEDASQTVKPGDYAVFDSRYVEFGDNKVKAKALDDRAGCAVLIEVMKQKERYDFDLYACFSVQEEVGLRGAEVLGYSINPDIAIVVEATTCSDVPGVDEHLHTTLMGKGPAITIMDGASYANKELVEMLVNAAHKGGIPFQFKKGTAGGNDAGRIHLAREGVKTATVSIPCRYIHSPSSVMDLTDYGNTINLISAFLKGCEV
ncbi:endoglucanase [Caldicoprobacter guelmensis]|uniref:M42 family metallopeptidase n=1 Tax=Caldicoprobacter guelmensis TaxID=1170224 RepID=UPI00195B6464|nr:M42 family metallopeptidase [Caldicoprobacter guelmensis]MBM7582275.1 endoglucanase [Caldicoprobacter guelmensis]